MLLTNGFDVRNQENLGTSITRGRDEEAGLEFNRGVCVLLFVRSASTKDEIDSKLLSNFKYEPI